MASIYYEGAHEYQSEHEMCLVEARMRLNGDEKLARHSAAIKHVVAVGLVAVVECSPVFCRATDAYVGVARHLVGACRSYADAERFVCAEYQRHDDDELRYELECDAELKPAPEPTKSTRSSRPF